MYERGAFTPRDTLATAAALQFYAVGLLGYSVVRIASPTFYALGRNRTPVIVSIIAVLVNAALNFVLVRTCMGYRGLALGTSIAALFNATPAARPASRAPGGPRTTRGCSARSASIAIASAAMGLAAVWLVRRAADAGCPATPSLTDRRGLARRSASRVTVLAAAACCSDQGVQQGVAMVLARRSRDDVAAARCNARSRRVRAFHRTVLLLAGTHFVVDGYGNILAPLLPLLIPNLHLSLSPAGHAADVLPDGQLRLAAGVRPHRGPLAAAGAAHRRAAPVASRCCR